MIENFQNWEKAYVIPKQLFGGIVIIIVACTFLIADILVLIKKLKKHDTK
jgi:hypothetical protein